MIPRCIVFLNLVFGRNGAKRKIGNWLVHRHIRRCVVFLNLIYGRNCANRKNLNWIVLSFISRYVVFQNLVYGMNRANRKILKLIIVRCVAFLNLLYRSKRFIYGGNPAWIYQNFIIYREDSIFHFNLKWRIVLKFDKKSK